MKSVFKLLPVALLFFSISVNAQSKNVIKRANEMTEYITGKMSLNEERSKLLNEALIEKFEFQKEKRQGKELTKEQKKAINKEAFVLFKTKLKPKFTKEEIQTINGHIKDFNTAKKETKKES